VLAIVRSVVFERSSVSVLSFCCPTEVIEVMVSPVAKRGAKSMS